jgi:hypothetical protein
VQVPGVGGSHAHIDPAGGAAAGEGGKGGGGATARPGAVRRTSTFSIASLTASVAGIASKERSRPIDGASIKEPGGAPREWGPKREMVDVSSSSRPGSIYESREGRRSFEEEEGEDEIGSDEDGERGREEEGSDVDADADEAGDRFDDTRSIRSMKSVRSVRSVRSDKLGGGGVVASSSPSPVDVGSKGERMSLSERFAKLASSGGALSPASESSSLPKVRRSTLCLTRLSPSPTFWHR